MSFVTVSSAVRAVILVVLGVSTVACGSARTAGEGGSNGGGTSSGGTSSGGTSSGGTSSGGTSSGGTSSGGTSSGGTSSGGSVAVPLAPEELRRSVGGGFRDGGLVGRYYASETFAGAAAFQRKDVRVDFDWGSVTRPGGSTSPGFRDVPHDHFSAIWEGTLVPAFSETYTLSVDASDGARLSVRPSGAGAYTAVVDFLSGPAGSASGPFAFTAGQAYDVKLEYRHATGPARLSLQWASPSFPREVIDTTVAVGLNDQELDQAFTDMVKGARNTWASYDYSLGLDENGWPRGDCEYVVQESLNHGLDISPLERGKMAFRFHGNAAGVSGHAGVEIYGNVVSGSLAYAYDAASNTTSGSFTSAERGSNVIIMRFFGTHRSGTSGPGGFTDLQIMRPTGPDATAAYPFTDGPTFTPQYLDAYARFTAIRFQLVADHERDWSERTTPGWFNQAGGRQSSPKFDESFPGAPLQARRSGTAYTAGQDVTVAAPDGLAHVYYVNNDGATAAAQPAYRSTTGGIKDGYQGEPGEMVQDGGVLMIEQGRDDGPSWEHKILLANETGRDLMVSIPPLASDDYVRRLAQLFRYGSDGLNPYTAETASPVYPPLDSNLRVYFEIGNELWNWGGVFWHDYRAFWDLVYVEAATPTQGDFPILNYDGLPMTRNAKGEYDSAGEWVKRKWVVRTKQLSDLFAEVYGPGGIHRRFRPVFEWQYDNTYTADALQVLEDWFDNGDGKSHVATPQPPGAFLWGGGGATYYGATDPDGLTDAIPPADGFFTSATVAAGYHTPASGPWTFTGTAGIARPPSGGASTSTGLAAGGDVPQAPTTRGARARDTAYAVGDTVYVTADDGLRHLYRCTQAGTSGTVETPSWGGPSQAGVFTGAAGQTVADGAARFQEFTSQVGYVQGTGRLAYTFRVPAFTRPSFAVSFKAVIPEGAGDAGQRIKAYLDGVDVTAPTFSGGASYRPQPYSSWQVGADWGANNVSWTGSHYFSTKIFQASAAGETHTLELRGQSDGTGGTSTAAIAFVADVRLASVDAIFASGVPGGGQAAGQPPGQRYEETMRVETTWARLYGLQPTAYEGGWSIGGDDGGTMLQNQAKMGGGSLTAGAQRTALDSWHRLGGAFAAQGTYAQWPMYGDYSAVEGLIDVGSWPLMQGIAAALNAPRPTPAAPADGIAPGTDLVPGNAAAQHGDQYLTDLRAGGAWTAWNVVLPSSKRWPISLDNFRPTGTGDAGHVTVALVVDGTTVVQSSTPGAVAGSIFLTRGLHTVRVQSRNAGHLSYDRVTVGP